MKVLSWNLFLLPLGLSKGSSQYRLKYIAAYLTSCNADVLCLQELFGPKQYKYLKKQLSAVYPFDSGVPKRVGLDLVSSGLVLFSKKPLEQVEFQEFKAKASVDALSSKGILSARVKIDESKSYQIINTHLQYVQNNSFFISLRKKQLIEIKDRVGDSYKTIDTLLTGDLNIDSHNSEFEIVNEIFEEVSWNVNEPFAYSVDGIENTLKKKNERSRIDHIFLLLSDPSRISQSHVHRPKCANQLDLSDHFPVSVDINL